MYVFVDLHTVAQIKKKENTDQYDLETRARWDERREREREGGGGGSLFNMQRWGDRYEQVSNRRSSPNVTVVKRQKDNAFFSRYPPLLPIVITGLVDV